LYDWTHVGVEATGGGLGVAVAGAPGVGASVLGEGGLVSGGSCYLGVAGGRLVDVRRGEVTPCSVDLRLHLRPRQRCRGLPKAGWGIERACCWLCMTGC